MILLGGLDGAAAVARSRDPAKKLRFVRFAGQSANSDNLWGLIDAIIEGRDSLFGGAGAARRADLRALYQSDHSPIWIDETGQLTENARDALRVLDHASGDGLDPADYYPELLALLTPRKGGAPVALEDLARFEVVVSAAMLRYFRDVHTGRIDQGTGFRLDPARGQHDFPALLRSAVAGERVAAAAGELRPSLSQYRMLREALARYRQLAGDVSLDVPWSITRVVHPGDSYVDTGQLQYELAALGDFPPGTPVPPASDRYVGPIVDAVRHFQVRHGLEPDGVIGRQTIAALRVPITWRVRQIELALERLRWLPHFGDERFIVLNIPMFRLWAWDAPLDPMPSFGMDVIVGRAMSTETPVLIEELREVVFRPYWNVPRSILRNELLPRIGRDPDVLRREHLEIVRGTGDDADGIDPTADAIDRLGQGELRLRQQPGPTNTLGLIKFVFPNRENVALHGTPAQALFAKSRRDFSHGCIRVADPVALAEWALQDRPEWTREHILAATRGTETIHVGLLHAIQVVVYYSTAAVMPEDGTVRFAEDIYQQDTRLDRALAMRQLDH